MLKILALGNSFSTDATAHLEKMTQGAYVRNLYIGGCSLERHAENLRSHRAAYEYQRHGVRLLESPVSANGVFEAVDWDVITVQQASPFSGQYESYRPYLDTVLSYVHALCPGARVLWHQTWAYATDFKGSNFGNYDWDQEKMDSMITLASRRAASEFGLGMIGSGEAIRCLRKAFPTEVGEFCRDGFHLSYDYGRYAAAYVWANSLGLPVDPFYVPEGAKAAHLAEIRAALDAHLR